MGTPPNSTSPITLSSQDHISSTTQSNNDFKDSQNHINNISTQNDKNGNDLNQKKFDLKTTTNNLNQNNNNNNNNNDHSTTTLNQQYLTARHKRRKITSSSKTCSPLSLDLNDEKFHARNLEDDRSAVVTSTNTATNKTTNLTTKDVILILRNENSHDDDRTNANEFKDDDDDDDDDDCESQDDSFGVPSDLLEKLRTFSLFKNAPPLFHRLIARRLKLMQLHPQEYIVKAGEPLKSMYWILRGTVGVTSTDGEATYAELAAGSFFGEIGILFNRPRTATVVARTKVLLGVLTKRALSEVLPDYPIIERLIRDEAQERLAMQEKKKTAGLVSLPSRRNSTSTNISGVNASVALSAASSIPGPSIPPLQHNKSSFSNFSTMTTSTSDLNNHHHHDHHHQSVVVVENPNSSSSLLLDDVDETIPAREFLKNLPLFQNLPSLLIHELALNADLKKLRGFEYIFRKGDLGTDIFFVVAGLVEIIDPSKSNVILARLGPGKYFGEMAFLSALSNGNDGDKRSADIRTIDETVLMIVTGQNLKNLCEKYPLIQAEMKQTAVERCKHNGSIDDDSLHSIEQPPLFKEISFHSVFNDDKKNDLDLITTTTTTPEQITWKDGYSEVCTPRVESPDPRSVSPLSDKLFSKYNSISTGASTPSSQTGGINNGNNNNNNNGNRRMHSISINDSSSSSCHCPNPMMNSASNSSIQQTTNLAVPPLNPQLPSLNSLTFNNKNGLPFQYMPLAKRMRLNNNNNSFSRRRSSVLSTGPLSDRIMLQVFAHIDLKNVMKMRRVCRRWRQLLLIADTLFHTLDLTPWNTTITDQSLKCIVDFVGPRPTIIDISNCFHITDEGFSYLVNEIGIKGSIKVLKMRSVWKVSAMAIMDLSVPSVGKNLERVDLVNCRNVRDDVLERLVGGGVDFYSRFDSRGNFNIQFDNNNDNNNNHHHHHRYHSFGCMNLKYLDLSYCKHLTDRTMSLLAEHMSDRLETLIITRCTTITDNGFRAWSSKQFINLQKLVLKDCTYLTDNSMIYLATLAPNLKHLDLSFCCALNDSSIDFLCFCCKHLQYLDLSFCGSAVSDISLVSISRLTNLTKLVIVGCLRVTREGVDRLLAGSRSLRLINLSQCKNAHDYPYGGGPAEKWVSNPSSRSLFIKVEPFDRVIEIIL